MKFVSQAQRLAHPLAKYIPSTLWLSVFDEEFTTTQEALMLASINEIKQKLPQLQTLSLKQREASFCALALKQDKLTAKTLISLALDNLQIDQARLIQLLSSIGRTDALKQLAQQSPEALQTIINDLTLKEAAANGQLEVLQFIATIIPHKLQALIAANRFAVFHIAALNKHHTIVHWLFSQSPACFIHAENHTQSYSHYTYPFIESELNRFKKQAQLHQSPQTLFNLDNVNDVMRAFYFARQLIRRVRPSEHMALKVRDDLLFLLTIPQVKALAHTSVNQGPSNELLRQALSFNNQDAVKILLAIPEVLSLAEANHHYQAELQASIDPINLAHNHESATENLNLGEKQRLQSTLTHYQNILSQTGSKQIIEHYKTWLIKKYTDNPAFITIDNKSIALPTDWESFTALKLDDLLQKQALIAYYQHPYHSAWRYLQKPNPWIHEHSFYTLFNIQNPKERWSSFQEYQDLIALLWLAASDEKTPATGEHSIEGRKSHFAHEMAYIERTHNWEQSRLKEDATQEEYDDLEADRPACSSGTKRQLFQAVIGHPLLNILTKDDIQQELRDFVRQQFQNTINDANRKQLSTALNHYFSSLDESAIPPLLILNIPKDKSDAFVTYLTKKYGDQFKNDPILVNKVLDTLTLTYKADAMTRSHALRFAGIVNLVQLLNVTISSSTSQIGIFAPSTSRPSATQAASHIYQAKRKEIAATQEKQTEQEAQEEEKEDQTSSNKKRHIGN